MAHLIITEKPSVARDLAAALKDTVGLFLQRDGYFENDTYHITWAFGHLVGLADPGDYNSKDKKWRLDRLPIIPSKFRLKTHPKTRKQYEIIKDLLLSQKVTHIVNACDAGREGELIFRNIYDLSGCGKPVRRLWLSETTHSAIARALQDLRPGGEFDGLGAAARARSEADWLVGLNATRAFSVKYSELLSVGRVQTPTLALIVDRERAIKNFRPAPYWELHVTFTKDAVSYVGQWFADDADRFDDVDTARVMADKVTAAERGLVISAETKDIAQNPPHLFNLVDLQKEANRIYGLSAADTLAAAQALYEKYKLITYPRTDSKYITEDLLATLPARLKALEAMGEYADLVLEAQEHEIAKRSVNAAKVTDHHAIIPTDREQGLSVLPANERHIYDLVVRRFLAAYLDPARYQQTVIITVAAEETFKTRGRVQLDAGWRLAYGGFAGKEKEDEGIIPAMESGDEVIIVEGKAEEKKTRAPRRYNDASILSAMENAGRLVDDEELREAMRGAGLGTPATRAAILERLIKVGYIRRSGKSLAATAKGGALIDIVPDQIKNPELTAEWEQALKNIESGEGDVADFNQGIRAMARGIIDFVQNQQGGVMPGKQTLGKCPLCGSPVVESKKAYGCSAWQSGCKFAIWKRIAGKRITAKQAQALLAKGKTGKLKGFKSRKGTKFDTTLVLNKSGKVTFDFGN